MLEPERKKASFKKHLLTDILYDGTENFMEFKKMQDIIDNDDILKFDPKYIQTHRKVNLLAHAQKMIRHHQMAQFSYAMKGRQVIFFSEQMPLSLHFYMFLITLNNLCTDRQIEQFYKPAVKCQILGCYAQTQLSHGSDIQSLTTTAKYDETTETFVLNTPDVGGIKWWIGDLGLYANHAIIFAQLIIKNKKYGLHAFLVPIRDKEHNAFPGVEVGDIGPKYGYNCKDNGYIKFDNYRIKRRYMLMKYAKVSKSGVYQRRGNQKISYATMLLIRSTIPYGCYYSLSKGCTIAVRYSIYRTQFKDQTGKQIPIIDYQLQQEKVFPRIAQLYATIFGAKKINEISRQVFQAAKERQDFSRLNQAHSLASGLKAIFTTDSTAGLQILRRSLGGHGFSSYSGLPGLISELSPMFTYQGQNTILYLQTARFLLKGLKYIAKGKQLPPTVEYIREIYADAFVADFSEPEEALCPENLRKIYLYHSCYALQRVASKMTDSISDGEDPKKVWDEKVGLDLVESGISHTYFWIFDNFLTKVKVGISNEALKKVLTNVLLLYGIDKILMRSAQFYSTGVITASTVQQLKKAKQILLAKLRPQALTLVEAFEYSDNTLHSAIGGAHQKPYQTLLDWAKNSNQVNQPQILKQIYATYNEAKKQFKPKL